MLSSKPQRAIFAIAWTVLFVLAIVSNAVVGGEAPRRASVESLLRAISENANDFDPYKVDRKIKLAVELGNLALPQLVSGLERASSNQEREALGTAIAYIGGASAIGSLKAAEARSLTPQLKECIAFATPSAPSRELTDLLEGYLKGPHLGASWPLSVQSAYSLGIMRAGDAVPALRAVADEPAGYASFVSSAAQDAIDWIAGPGVSMTFLATSPNDDLLRAVLSSGVPSMSINRRPSWCDSAGRR